MNHQEVILAHRLYSLKDGIKTSSQNIIKLVEWLSTKEVLAEHELKQVQNDLAELNSFIVWLSQQ